MGQGDVGAADCSNSSTVFERALSAIRQTHSAGADICVDPLRDTWEARKRGGVCSVSHGWLAAYLERDKASLHSGDTSAAATAAAAGPTPPAISTAAATAGL